MLSDSKVPFVASVPDVLQRINCADYVLDPDALVYVPLAALAFLVFAVMDLGTAMLAERTR
jgi:hypothetical protein